VSDRLPEWTVEIGFSSSLGRQITFDGTEFDDPFVGFGSGFTQFFDGPLDDVSAHVEEITITRGRDDLLGDMAAGQATLTLIDPPGQFGYFNPEEHKLTARRGVAGLSAHAPDPHPRLAWRHRVPGV